MTNEEKLKLILNDPLLFIQTFIKIVDKRGKLVSFIPNPQQKYLLNEMDKFNVVLKSRQLGISVLSCAYSIWLAIRYPTTSCLLMAHSLDGADGIFTKLKQLYGSIPAVFLLPDPRQDIGVCSVVQLQFDLCGVPLIIPFLCPIF